MSKTARSTWKKVESRDAKAFGAKRNIGSGSMGRDDKTASDSTHPVLFIECKLRSKSSIRTLYDDTAKKARKEKKIPLVIQHDKNRPGALLTMMLEDLPIIAAEYAKAKLAAIKGDLPGQANFIGGGDEIDDNQADD